MTHQHANPWLAGGSRGDDYEARFAERAAAGQDVHGEADFVERLGVSSVLDAGCGTGRVARELARRGLDVIGVDLDPRMLETARRLAPEIEWHQGDLASVDLGRRFDAVVMAGNVMLFLTPGTEPAVVRNTARPLAPGGLLVAGFQLGGAGPAGGRAGVLTLEHYDALAADAGLELTGRWATWDRAVWRVGGDYAVSVHQRSTSAR